MKRPDTGYPEDLPDTRYPVFKKSDSGYQAKFNIRPNNIRQPDIRPNYNIDPVWRGGE